MFFFYHSSLENRGSRLKEVRQTHIFCSKVGQEFQENPYSFHAPSLGGLWCKSPDQSQNKVLCVLLWFLVICEQEPHLHAVDV